MEQITEFRDNNLELILSFFNEHRGQFVLVDKIVYRLIAVATDDFDYYWVLYNGRKLRWTTCLTNIVPLKNTFKDGDYQILATSSKLNDFDQVEYWGHKNLQEAAKFREEHIKEITFTEGKDSRYMTELEWNIF